ncbi:MAG: ABC transporter permease, partial [Schleiferiaceae bacterium]|nr:ABC transporter permease [Schleiferiaceae bacterium]
MKIIIMAWRNIWRTPWRSLVVIGAMSLGVWSGIFMMGWINGINDQRTISMLDDNVGHGRICSKDFLEKPEVFSTINNLEAFSNRLVTDSNITTFSSRVICNSMIQAGSGSAPIIAYGVNPNNEKKVFKSVQNISSGEFLKGQVGDEVVLGEALARKLEIDIDDRVVLTFQDINGDVRSALFWLVGIYNGASSMIEESIIYVPSKTISFQMGLIDSIKLSNKSQIIAHEINYRVKNP